ncbi:type II toxin-antitoxin system VapB family antitoxin [Limnoraphis robusta Tam1]|uniref:Type II toxin-antitoxin system VapB family antitoxin n=1 Tax=Limnoraphis robusta CCNP1315 TaxID=3110306 RepID=A0ABU5U3E7_9CYAN|nr:type II toxin-antitoxin system VapB family antitoxin [Limnoraphis robusta]MEA5499574.1 type II toxin-antitoxin system VapB family antitoxin [Limnoraphis robusta BA-68 BA1]MEA5521644.1 type II toxin-antitoxin system VapB family antitoxin [Limnoraphis robusta CCNP1315]MEA5542489.1 type II toxin-antitoxin system VapB family antitoxin [Limnoraphis robusta Tam1]MEA5548191.1 type II toxin-antitoxin system VapB family antitoxin [Limnoraphis robusta CCNP1324]
MNTNIELNEQLVKEALELTQLTTEKEVIEFALQELIRTRKKRKNLLDLSGQIEFATDRENTTVSNNICNTSIIGRGAASLRPTL